MGRPAGTVLALVLGVVLLVLAVPARGNEDCTRIDFIPMWMDQSPVQGACDGFGDCTAGVCACDEGHFGRADFFDATGVACQQNFQVIRFMYVFSLLVTVTLYMLPIRLVRMRWRQFLVQRAEAAARGKRRTLLNNRGLLAMVVHYSVVRSLCGKKG